VFALPLSYEIRVFVKGVTEHPLWSSFAFHHQYIYMGNQESFHCLQPNQGGLL
jgi:hypothetical protein